MFCNKLTSSVSLSSVIPYTNTTVLLRDNNKSLLSHRVYYGCYKDLGFRLRKCRHYFSLRSGKNLFKTYIHVETINKFIMTTIMFSLALFCLTVENKIKLSASKSIEVWSRGPWSSGSDSSRI